MNVQCYSVNINKTFDSMDLLEKTLKNIYQCMLRLKRKNPCYAHISFLVGISETDSKDAKPVYIYSHKKGRPRKVIVGSKTKRHIHIYVFSTDYTASKYAHEICENFKRKYRCKVFLNKNKNPHHAIDYISKQCISLWGHPHFESNYIFYNKLY